jgi:ABC-2 type transport system ATP-binding protein
LRVLAATAGLPDDRVEEVLADFALTGVARRRVGGFSLGMRQRLGLAAAMLGRPEILVLDEPTNGLDPAGVRWLREFVRGYAGAGHTVLVSSHLLAEVAQTVDEAIVLVAGRLVAHAPLSQLAGSRAVVRIRTPQAAALRVALDAHGIEVEQPSPELVLAHGAPIETVGRAIAAAGLVVYEITQDDTALEQAFLDLTTTAT